MKKETFWVLGAGRFGSLAVQRLLEQRRETTLLVVDHDGDRLGALKERAAKRIQQDGIDFLLANLGERPDWIVPAIPVHVAFVWLSRKLSEEGQVTRLPVPTGVDSQVPNPWRDEADGLYASFADFRCPDDCEEPVERCTVTGEPRSVALYELLAGLEVPGYMPLVVRSHQLAPGVGGYQPSALWKLVEQVKSTANPVMVATACRCHGVVHALRWRGPQRRGQSA